LAVAWLKVPASGSFSNGSRGWACGGVKMGSTIYFTYD